MPQIESQIDPQIDPAWLRHATQTQLKKLTGFGASRLSLWMNGVNRPQKRSRQRFLKTGMKEAQLDQLLDSWAADAQERQKYQQELDQMIAGQIPVKLTAKHVLHSKVRQLHSISGVNEMQFSHWFNNPEAKLSKLSASFLASKFKMTEEALVAAIQQRQARVQEINAIRKDLDKYLNDL